MPGADRSGALVLVQHYGQIRQFGLDAQLTIGSWLFKLEAIQRAGARNLLSMEEDYVASVFGGEYTFYSVFGSAVDLSSARRMELRRAGAQCDAESLAQYARERFLFCHAPCVQRCSEY